MTKMTASVRPSSTADNMSWKLVSLSSSIAAVLLFVLCPTLDGAEHAELIGTRPLSLGLKGTKEDVDKMLYCDRTAPTGLQNGVQGLLSSESCNATITKGTITTFTCEGSQNNSLAVRINVVARHASQESPVLFVVREQMSILSWQVPLLVESHEVHDYHNVCRTLCPRTNDTEGTIKMDMSTFSLHPINVTVTANLIQLDLKLWEEVELWVSPSEPVYYRYTFQEGEDHVRVVLSSNDTHCAVLSIQDTKCPVYDEAKTVEFKGVYQSVGTQGAIAVQRQEERETEDFFVVVVVYPNDHPCTAPHAPYKSTVMNKTEGGPRTKHLTIQVLPTATMVQYIRATVGTVAIFLIFYIISFIVFFFNKSRKESLPGEEVHSTDMNSLLDPCRADNESAHILSHSAPNYGATREGGDNPHGSLPHSPPFPDLHIRSGSHGGGMSNTLVGSPPSPALDLEEYDQLSDIEEEKDVFRMKTFLYVSDLSRKKFSKLNTKYKVYAWNLLTIAIFYGLPVIQLVITYQKVVNQTGNQDMCYYNFFCSSPLGFLSSFNNVFSNVGYVLLGILFIIIVYLRERHYKSLVLQDKRHKQEYGIPQYFGLYYAMGIALFMEGLLSASYHVCPNSSNYQFDTAFMYMIGWLGMLKIYQIRHPDINANSHTAYFALAVLIMLGVVGVLQSSQVYWALFAVLYIVCVVMVSIHLYFMGRWRLNFGVFKRLYLLMKADRFSCLRPTYVDRFLILLFGNIINWAVAITAAAYYPRFSDFASYLLGIVIINLFYYLAFYIVMKLRSGECLRFIPLSFFLGAAIVWGFALYFFMAGLTSWQETPAMSREHNRPCLLFSFYDAHDVWHVLSAIGLFLSFMATLYLDDDIATKKRDTIPVF